MTESDSNLILALETSGRQGSVALLRGGAVLGEGQIQANQRTAAAMTPLIAEVVHSANLELSQVDVLGVTIGPGSFTGLRVGVTTAKTLAYVLKCEVVGVNTLDVIAHRMPATISSVKVVLDAQRQQLFVADYQRDNQGWMVAQQATSIVDKDAWLDSLTAGDSVTGPAVGKLTADLPADIHVVDRDLWEPTAASVAAVALQRYQAGQRDDFWKLVPLYFRPSAAEEKLGSASKPGG